MVLQYGVKIVAQYVIFKYNIFVHSREQVEVTRSVLTLSVLGDIYMRKGSTCHSYQSMHICIPNDNPSFLTWKSNQQAIILAQGFFLETRLSSKFLEPLISFLVHWAEIVAQKTKTAWTLK